MTDETLTEEERESLSDWRKLLRLYDAANARADAAERSHQRSLEISAGLVRANELCEAERDQLKARVAELEAELDKHIPEPPHCLGGGGHFD